MNVTVRIPKRENSVTVSICSQYFITLHSRVLPVDILQDIGMYQRMVKGSIKDSFLFFRPAFDKNTRKVLIPTHTGICQYLTEILSTLFCIQIQAGIFDADKRNSHLHFDLFTFRRVESKKSTDIISGNFLTITGIKFVVSIVRIPFSFNSGHGTLFFPITAGYRLLVDTHYKINGKYCLGVIAESSQ